MSLCSKPLRKSFQVIGVHPQHDFFPVAAVNGKDVVFVEDHRIALMKLVQSGVVQRVVHDTPKPLAVTLTDSHPKVFSPAT